jgi:phosphatidylserine/phosphatidylglycerophosphate/cardiolipin synthase-like enzyme
MQLPEPLFGKFPYSAAMMALVFVMGLLFGGIAGGWLEKTFWRKSMKRLCFLILFTGSAAFAEPTFEALFHNSPVCFSPEETCDDKLASFYDLADKSIDVAIYDINRPRLVEALIKKSKSIPVRIVCDERQSKGPHSAITELVRSGVQVRFGHQKGIMHNKFSVVDGSVLETGSFNYTTHAATANQENQVYFIDPKMVSIFASKFEAMWTLAKPYGAKKAEKSIHHKRHP